MNVLWGFLFFSVCSLGSGVLGFCAGGLLGPRLFGSAGGHGLAELGSLFGGALLGLLAGIVVSVVGLRSWDAPRRFIVASGLGVGAAAVSALVAIIGW